MKCANGSTWTRPRRRSAAQRDCPPPCTQPIGRVVSHYLHHLPDARKDLVMPHLSRRTALQSMLAAGAAPFVWRMHAHAAPSESVIHASFGSSGMAGSDIGSLTGNKHLVLAAVAEVDSSQKNLAELKKKYPQLRVYEDYRVLLDKEKDLNSVNVSTPDHMHGSIGMRALQRGLAVYGQKPMTQTLYEARRLAEVAAEKKLVTQMGIQIHSSARHKLVVKLIHDGAIGRVKEVHSWSNK